MPYLLAIDQGTTSTRAVVYDERGHIRGVGQQEITQHFPHPGWVEHDPAEIWRSVLRVVPEAIEKAKVAAKDIAGIGLTNQRETVVFWDRATSQPLGRAIVWQDRRTSDFCRERAQDEPWMFQKTGLVLDPYFSATKMCWFLDNQAGLRQRALDGKIACGTIDTWLLWNLTGGQVHATDVTNASRTLLLDLDTRQFDDELCEFFAIPKQLLPQIQPSSSQFGKTAKLDILPDGLPIAGIAGDQQAALFGQGAFSAGDAKCTYGTGAFFLQHTGTTPIHSQNRLLTSLAATIDDRAEYVLEGSVFIAGAAVQWLRDGLQLLKDSKETERMAGDSDLRQAIYFVPGFVGLGAPHWLPEARGVIFGLTRSTTPADLARATLEGVAFQVTDLLEAAEKDSGQKLTALRVDGGMARNGWFLQNQADVVGLPVIARPDSEATALGAAFLAGLHVGVWPDRNALQKILPQGEIFAPRIGAEERERRRGVWRRAVRAVVDFYRPE